MILYLMRHSCAVKGGEDGEYDADRPLTDEGIEKANEVACGLERLLDPMDLPKAILTSPAKRCYQTGEVIVKHWEIKPVLKADEHLSEGEGSEGAMHCLFGQSGVPVMFIMHHPDLVEFLGHLIGGGPKMCVEFKRAAVAKIEFEDEVGGGKGCLCWLYNPGIIRQFS